MKCPDCNGRGFINKPNWEHGGMENTTCHRCGGSGDSSYESVARKGPDFKPREQINYADLPDLRTRLAECEREKTKAAQAMIKFARQSRDYSLKLDRLVPGLEEMRDTLKDVPEVKLVHTMMEVLDKLIHEAREKEDER